jgi:hypothetical protein
VDVPWSEKFHRRGEFPQETLPESEARERFNRTWGHRAVPSNSGVPFQFVDHLPYEAWGLSPWGSWWIHVPIPVEELHCRELEKDVRYSASVRRYARWMSEGHRPPPIIVMRHREGYLVSHNRRRVIAAQEAGVDLIPAWFSEWDHETKDLMWK